MYLTAQRVRSSSGGEGVNSFLFSHREAEIPEMSWDAPDVALVADQYPGKAIVQRIEIESRFNDVLSFLDVVAREDATAEQVLQALSAEVVPGAGGIWFRGSIACRYFQSKALGREDHLELETLRTHVALLLRGRAPESSRVPVTGQVHVIARDDPGFGVVYHLEPGDRERVARPATRGQPATVRIAYEDRALLARCWGGDAGYDRAIGALVTGLEDRELDRLGRVVIEDAHRQRDAALVATTEELPGQLAGDWFGPDEEIPVTPLTTWPTGALLRRGDLALDLVYLERAWFPLSEAALYTYRHTTGLIEQQEWRFVTRTDPPITYLVSLGPSLARHEVEQGYGADAAARCRPDHPTLQLHVRAVGSES